MGGLVMSNEEKYEKVARELLECVGGKENIVSVAHCATRLRIVLDSNNKANIKL